MGAWGFFACENGPEAAARLFSAVQDRVSSKELTFLQGPLNPSTNYEVGLLIEGVLIYRRDVKGTRTPIF